MKKSSWWWWWWWCIFFCGKLEDVKQHYFWELACERRKWRLHILGCATEVNKNHGWTWSCPDFACLTSHLKSNQYYFIYCITIGITCFVWFCSVLAASHPYFYGSNNPGIVVLCPQTRVLRQKNSHLFCPTALCCWPILPNFPHVSFICLLDFRPQCPEVCQTS